ncbi:MAG: DNA repair protein RadA [bacterium]|nr:DNA repair protein RadA [bacterium]
MKQEPLFSCAKCDAQFLKWAGQCSQCGAWGTIKQSDELPSTGSSTTRATTGRAGILQSFESVTATTDAKHQATGFSALDRVLSGGLVPGSVTLIGGEPGVGKSTLLAQIGLVLASQNKSIIYVTGEESPSQVGLRLKRMRDVIPSSFSFLDDTNASTVAATIDKTRPALVIVDSIQSMRAPSIEGETGNPTQLRASAAIITEAAKKTHVPVILIGQVTKEGDLAGPRLLEHLVDTVLMMEGDQQHIFRLLRVTKNRFGATDELAVFRMSEKGLEEVLDPSSSLIADRPKNTPGTVITCLADGTRPLLIEIQALVTPAGYGTPIRRASGIDQMRLQLLIAVLARRAGVNLTDQDVFVNAVGGVDAKEPGVDLAICLALASAKYDVMIPETTAAWGEVGLSGEIRPVANEQGRVKETKRLGLEKVISAAKETSNSRHINQALDLLGLRRNQSSSSPVPPSPSSRT